MPFQSKGFFMSTYGKSELVPFQTEGFFIKENRERFPVPGLGLAERKP